MEKKLVTAACVYCGQVTQFETDKEMSQEKYDEAATLKCTCAAAREHQKRWERKQGAMENVDLLFQEEQEAVIKALKRGVELICSNMIEKITLNLYAGVKATISQNSKGEINVERTVTCKQKLTR